jgi:hypothetical protein
VHVGVVFFEPFGALLGCAAEFTVLVRLALAIWKDATRLGVVPTSGGRLHTVRVLAGRTGACCEVRRVPPQ